MGTARYSRDTGVFNPRFTHLLRAIEAKKIRSFVLTVLVSIFIILIQIKMQLLHFEFFDFYNLRIEKLEEEDMRIFFSQLDVRKEILLRSDTPEELYSNMLEAWGNFCFQKEEEERRKAVYLESPFEVSKLKWAVIGGLVIFSILCCINFYIYFDINTIVVPTSSPSVPTNVALLFSYSSLSIVSFPEVMEPISVAISSGMGNTINFEQNQEMFYFFDRSL